MLKIARNNEETSKSNITYQQGDCFEKLNTLNNIKFDVLSSFWMINHCNSSQVFENCLTHMKSYLNDNGFFLGITFNVKENIPNPKYFKNIVKFGFGSYPANKDTERENFEENEAIDFRIFDPSKPDVPILAAVDYWHSYELFNGILNKLYKNVEFIEVTKCNTVIKTEEAEDVDYLMKIGTIFKAFN